MMMSTMFTLWPYDAEGGAHRLCHCVSSLPAFVQTILTAATATAANGDFGVASRYGVE